MVVAIYSKLPPDWFGVFSMTLNWTGTTAFSRAGKTLEAGPRLD